MKYIENKPEISRIRLWKRHYLIRGSNYREFILYFRWYINTNVFHVSKLVENMYYVYEKMNWLAGDIKRKRKCIFPENRECN